MITFEDLSNPFGSELQVKISTWETICLKAHWRQPCLLPYYLWCRKARREKSWVLFKTSMPPRKQQCLHEALHSFPWEAWKWEGRKQYKLCYHFVCIFLFVSVKCVSAFTFSIRVSQISLLVCLSHICDGFFLFSKTVIDNLSGFEIVRFSL